MQALPDGCVESAGSSWGVFRQWSVLSLVFTAELLSLTLSFESPGASAQMPLWLRLSSDAPQFIKIALAFLGALFVLLLPRRKEWLAQAWSDSASDRNWWRWLVLNGLAFGALYFATAETLKLGAGETISGAGVALCAALALAAALSWCVALLPARFWARLMTQEWRAMTLALVAATAAWVAGQVTEFYWRPLAAGTLFLSSRLLELFYPQVVVDNAELVFGTPNFRVAIAPQCAGYESIGLVTVFLALYLWLFRERIRFPHAFMLFPIGIAGVWLANVVRIALLVGIGTSVSPELALGGFHSQAGWISFVGLSLGVIAVTHRMRFFAPQPADQTEWEVNPAAAAMLVPFLALMGSMMATAAFSQGFDRFYPLRVLVVFATLLTFRRVYARWDWDWSWISVCIGVVVFALWIALEPAGPGGSAALAESVEGLGRGNATLWILFRIIGSVLLIPFVEELAFRGYLLRRLVSADWERIETTRFRLLPFVLSSTAFGFMHGRWLAGTLAGMAYALAVYRRGRLNDAIVSHMTTNALIAFWVLVMGAWSLWI